MRTGKRVDRKRLFCSGGEFLSIMDESNKSCNICFYITCFNITPIKARILLFCSFNTVGSSHNRLTKGACKVLVLKVATMSLAGNLNPKSFEREFPTSLHRWLFATTNWNL